MARDAEDIKYRGRRRWTGNHGRVWFDGALIFEIVKFEAKVTADREDVIIGESKDSKITSLSGEGTLTVKPVWNRSCKRFLEEWNAGHDPRTMVVATLEDPDMIDAQRESIVIDNVWIKEIGLMQFEKGKVVEKEFPFGFTPQDARFTESVAQ